jgi:hypothetical protein
MGTSLAFRPAWDPDRNWHHDLLLSDGHQKPIAYHKPACEALLVRFSVLVELSIGGFYDEFGPGTKGF